MRSAWIPAPPDGSEPAIVRTGGAGLTDKPAMSSDRVLTENSAGTER